MKLIKIIYYFIICHLFPNFLKRKIVHSSFKFKLIENRWYVDLPEWPGSFAQLEMVAGSADFLDIASNNGDFVEIKVSLTPFEGCSKFEKIGQTNMGATYQTYNYKKYNKKIWLCNVARFVFGEHPEKLYFKVKNC